MPNISKITYKGVTYDIYDASAVHSVTPYTLPVATYNVLGGVKPLYSNTGAVTGVTAASGSKTVAVNALSTTAGKYYAVEIDKDGRLYVNVPWTDTHDDQNLTGTMQSDGYSITISEGTSSAKVPFFSSSTATTGGMVKATAIDIGKYLKGDGTWDTPPDTNYQYTLGGNLASPSGYKVTLTGSNGGSNSETTIPIMGAASTSSGGSLGLVPTPASGDQIKFLKGDGTWATPTNTHYTYWFYDSEANYGTVAQGAGNWTATFPKDSALPASGFIKISGTNTTPAVGDLVITTGGFIGAVKSVSGSGSAITATVTFVGRMSFMAYNSPTTYDSATSTLILGSY